MSERSQPGVVAIHLEEEVPLTTQRALAAELGASWTPGPRTRWHRPDFLTVRVGAGPDLEALAHLPGVRRVALDPGLRAPAAHGPVLLGAVPVGGSEPVVIAGPCSVEGPEQLLRAAELVAEAGAVALRGGCFKPRSSPYAFNGLGEAGLELMARARERTGLPVVTEALERDQLDVVARYADAIQIGSRNMHNGPLLFDAGAHPAGRPVLLKRGLCATIDELLQAAEHVLLGRFYAGHTAPGLMLCERGIRTFDDAARFCLDVGAIPVLQARCGLPVLADPSHAAGERSLVAPLGRAAMAAGAVGLLVEVHPDPDRAWCDGPQSLDLEGFRALMRDLERLRLPAAAAC